MGWLKKGLGNIVKQPLKYNVWGATHDLVRGRQPWKNEGWQVLGAAGAAALGGAALAGGAGAGAAAGTGGAAAGGASMSPGWGALASGIIGAGTNWWSQSQTNAQNLDIAREQMNFQGMMSNTAHQREVADLKAAGLNPVLSAGGNGSSTPSGSQATMQAPQIDMPGIYSMMAQQKQLEQADARIANETARTTADLVIKEKQALSEGERIKIQKLQQILMQKGMPRATIEKWINKMLQQMSTPSQQKQMQEENDIMRSRLP